MPTEKKLLNVQIGSRIKKARESAHLTQEGLAEKVEVSVQYVSDLERGKVGASVATIIRICKVLQISSDYILFGHEPVAKAVPEQELLDLNEEQNKIMQEGMMLLLRAFHSSHS